MTSSNLEKGARGENIAVAYLENLGFKILHRNLRLSRYEIDIICRDNDCLVFVEVKYSKSQKFGHPATWIDDRKQGKLRQAAQLYCDKYDITDIDIRFDAITIENDNIEYYKNAF